ncbi:hypothetical protein D1610_13085 [Sphingomonas gilva]|uniref:DUF1795 domain-containing protein n=1 Tax=Sphingomonas gilva TaxID=2305907 RepID=A0A396RTQ3_9SPHN|nr:hypothetical protein [Sphingomonas gilva]RHW17051.1 hypothetical protein D1610_13085 [Sphingomonas gilva]
MTNKIAAMVAGLALLSAGMAHAQRKVESPPDPYVHGETGFNFPAAVGSFARQAVIEYNEEGTDVGVSYELIADGSIVALVSVYVYPSPSDDGAEDAQCRTSYDGAKQAITERFPDAKLVREDSRPAPDADARLAGDHVAYTITADFFSRQGAVASELYVYCPPKSGWQVKYRTSTPAGSEHDDAVQRFMGALEWPENLGG